MRISITNCTGTRNRGVEALVQCLVNGLRTSSFASDAILCLHTNDPVFDSQAISGIDRTYFSYPFFTPDHFRAMRLNRSLYRLASALEHLYPSRYSGISTRSLRCASKSDWVIPTGGDLFTSDYDRLRKQFAYSSIARRSILLGHTVGPFTKDDERYFLKNINQFFGITLRDSESYEYLTSLNLDIPIKLCADLAFQLEPVSREVSEDILRTVIPNRDQPIVGLALSEGIIRFAMFDPEKYYNAISQFIDIIHTKGRRTLLIPHVLEKRPNNNDWYACYEVWKRVKLKNQCSIIAGEYNAAEFKGVIRYLECLIGTRMHPTIASISQGIPSISIGYSRKAKALFNDVFGPSIAKSLVIDAKKLTSERLLSAYNDSLHNPIPHKSINILKSRARENFSFLKEIINDSN